MSANRRNGPLSGYTSSPPASPLHPHHPSSPAPPPAPPPPPPPGGQAGVTYSNVPGRIGKLNQLVQNFFAKAAQIILQSRITVVPTYQRGTTVKRTNKWFHMELDETETLRTELSPFRTATFAPSPQTPPPPLFLEVTLDTKDLTPNQTLILVSSQTGSRYTVETPQNRWLRGSEIVLERWCIDLVTPARMGAPDLPIVYKKTVVLFRRVFSEARLLPVWRLKKRLSRVMLNNSLKLRVRVVSGEGGLTGNAGRVAISTPLMEGQKERVTEEFSFGQIDTPAGAFDISVLYRVDTDFRVTDSEALLSSHFLHLDSSLDAPGSTSSSPRPRPYYGVDQSQAYGSLSSFHTLPQPGQHLSSSPLTALRNAPYMGTAGGPSTPPQQITTPYAHMRSPSQTSLSRLKDNASPLPRRPSVTFMQPFKAPSLGSSPTVDIPSSPRPASVRSSSGVARPSSLKESFTPQPFTALEDDTPPPSPSVGTPGGEGERRRYSSAFSARRERRESFHSASRLSSDVQRRRFSGMSMSSKPEEEASVSSGSLRADEEEDVGLFLRMVEERKELKSLGGTSTASGDLDRLRGMKNEYGALGDSVSGSIFIPRASPPTATGHVRSIGSGESPHTPVVRSRLSEGVITMQENRQATPPPPTTSKPAPAKNEVLKVPGAAEKLGAAKPLDIPNSPSMRSWGTGPRATSFTDHRLGRRTQQDQEISHQLLEDELDSARRHSSSLGSLEGIPASANSSFHRRKSSNESPAQAARAASTGRRESIGQSSLAGSVKEGGQGSLREKFYNALTGAGEEGDEGEELLFAMSDMMGDKR